jgi:hypothetical protein
MEIAQRARSLTGHFEEPKQGIAGNRLKDVPKSLTDAWLLDVIWFGPATGKGSGPVRSRHLHAGDRAFLGHRQPTSGAAADGHPAAGDDTLLHDGPHVAKPTR